MWTVVSGLLIIGGTVVGLLVAFTSTGRKLAQVVANSLVTDVMKNPKAAEGVYQQAIDEARESYSKASNTVNELEGSRVELQTKITNISRELQSIANQMERFAKNNDRESLTIIVQNKATLEKKLEIYQQNLEGLLPMIEEAKAIHKQWGQKVSELKNKKEVQISSLQLSKDMEGLYSKMDELRQVTATDKLLNKVDDNIASSKRRASGAKVAYENSVPALNAKVEQKYIEISTQCEVEDLLAKYNK